MTSDGSPRFSDGDYQDILALRDRLRRFLYWSEVQARRAGLTPAQHQLLLSIRGHPGDEDPTVGEIAEHLQLRHHSAVGLIDRAESSGLVKRARDQEDHRIVRVVLSPAGCDALARLTASHVEELRVLAEAFTKFHSPSPQEPSPVWRPAAPRTSQSPSVRDTPDRLTPDHPV